MTESESNNAN